MFSKITLQKLFIGSLERLWYISTMVNGTLLHTTRTSISTIRHGDPSKMAFVKTSRVGARQQANLPTTVRERTSP